MSSAERQYESDWLRWVVNREYSMELRIVEAIGGVGLAMKSGDVMRLGTGTKLKCVSASTGADAVAILAQPLSAAETIADKTGVLCLVGAGKGLAGGCYGGGAVVNGDQLQFSVSATQAAAAKAALLALGIVVLAEATSVKQTT